MFVDTVHEVLDYEIAMAGVLGHMSSPPLNQFFTSSKAVDPLAGCLVFDLGKFGAEPKKDER
jgi:hypothetical protein